MIGTPAPNRFRPPERVAIWKLPVILRRMGSAGGNALGVAAFVPPSSGDTRSPETVGGRNVNTQSDDWAAAPSRPQAPADFAGQEKRVCVGKILTAAAASLAGVFVTYAKLNPA